MGATTCTAETYSDQLLQTGQEFVVKFPFVETDYTYYDVVTECVQCEETWRPGTNSEDIPPEDTGAVADGEGEMILTIVDIHKPGRYPERVFYTRKFVDPDGKLFGSNKLHITTTPTFKKRAAGYYHAYRVK